MTHAFDNARLAATSAPTVADAAALRALTWYSSDPPEAVQVLSDDGGLFKYVGGEAPGTYVEDGGDYCGTIVLPTDGDGSEAWIRCKAAQLRATLTDDGDDLEVAFTVALPLDVDDDSTVFLQVTPRSEDAALPFWASFAAGVVTITFTSAPVTGSGNVVLDVVGWAHA